MEPDECQQCEQAEQGKGNHEKDLERAQWLFGVGAGTLGLIVMAIIWYFDKTTRAPFLGWFLAATAGTLVYLLRNVAEFRTTRHHFKRFSFWYASTLITGPILAVVVMWLLTNITFVVTPSALPPTQSAQPSAVQTLTVVTTNSPDGTSVTQTSTTSPMILGSPTPVGATVASGSADASGSVSGGIVLDLKTLALEAQLGVAFVLGFFGQTTTKQLELITRKLFPDAYTLAEAGKFKIKPACAKVVAGQSVQFASETGMEAVWSASGGDIGESTGVFVASRPDPAEFALKHGTITGVVKAHPTGVAYVYSSANVEIVPFEIQGEEFIKAGDAPLFKTVPAIDDVTWSASHSLPIDGTTGLLTTARGDKGKTIVVTAKSPKYDHSEKMVVRIT